MTDGLLYALHAGTGAVRWRSRIGETDSSPAIANGVVYIADATRRLVALEVLWRSERFAVSTDESTRRISSPALAGGAVLIGTPDGRLLAYRPAPG